MPSGCEGSGRRHRCRDLDVSAASITGRLEQDVDAYVSSLDVGFRKPHPAMFEGGLWAAR